MTTLDQLELEIANWSCRAGRPLLVPRRRRRPARGSLVTTTSTAASSTTSPAGRRRGDAEVIADDLQNLAGPPELRSAAAGAGGALSVSTLSQTIRVATIRRASAGTCETRRRRSPVPIRVRQLERAARSNLSMLRRPVPLSRRAARRGGAGRLSVTRRHPGSTRPRPASTATTTNSRHPCAAAWSGATALSDATRVDPVMKSLPKA